jgi:hypothetical protein
MTRRRPPRHLALTLTADEFDRLQADGERDMRDAWQQARYLLLRALEQRAQPEPDPDHADVA